MKKIFAAGMSILMSAALLFGTVGCVDMGDDPNAGKKPDDKPDTNDEASVEITYATINDSDEKALMRVWANAFMRKNKDVQISIGNTMSGMPDITGWESSGELPDIIWTAGDQHAPYSGSGYFQDLSDETKFPGSAEFFGGYYDALIDSTHYSNSDNGIWFMPRDYNRLVVYINVSAFEKAKLYDSTIEVPGNDWTWEEFLALCDKFVKIETNNRPLAAVGWEQWFPIEYTMLRNFGGEYLNADGTLALEDAKYSAGVKAYYEFYTKWYNDLKDSKGKIIRNPYGYNDQGAMFESYSDTLANSVPMMVGVRPDLSAYYDAAQTSEWELAVRAFPNFEQKDGGKGYVGAGCSGYGISKACNTAAKREWTWKFLQFCMSEEGYEEVAYLGNTVPALKALNNKGGWREYGDLDEESVNAFVDTHTNDIFLNYGAALAPNRQDTFNGIAKQFYQDAVSNKSYNDALNDFKQSFKDKIK